MAWPNLFFSESSVFCSTSPSETFLASIEATHAAGRALAEDLRGGDVVALIGDLGAGKTHLCQGVVEGLGSSALVTSPTFGLVHEYVDGAVEVYHFDFYRIEAAEELWEIGWDDYLERGGIVMVEWADRFPDLLPSGAQWWRLRHDAKESEGRWLQRLKMKG